MRDLFSEYYRPSNEEFSRLWREATFVFDANALLHLYRYTPGTRFDLLKVIEALQQRIWIPHQVGWEFSRNRAGIIIEQNQIIDLFKEFCTSIEEKFTKDLVKEYGKRGHFFANLEKIHAIFQKAEQDIEEELQRSRAEYPDPLQHDDAMLQQLDTLLQGRIGPPYSEERLTQLSTEFEKRYKHRVPPGWMDEKKSSQQKKDSTGKDSSLQEDASNNPANKYGDVILWYQLIDYAKQEKKPIILVEDDRKEDWWQRIHGKTQGPRPELIREMRDKANVQFYMYTFENFLKQANEFLTLQVQEETIQEVRETRIQEAKQRADQLALHPSSTLYPSLLLPSDALRYIGITQQASKLIGNLATLNHYLGLINRLDPLFLPHLVAQEDSESPQELQSSENEKELDQDDSPDGTSDDSSNG